MQTKSLSMPNLVKIGRDNTIDKNEIDNSGREISHRGNLLDLTLPKFTEVTNQLDILENFGSIWLISLVKCLRSSTSTASSKYRFPCTRRNRRVLSDRKHDCRNASGSSIHPPTRPLQGPLVIQL
ncbi:uncharacterized protein RAG0_12515 [Rhynchosporium agropyri]|uniref:Uncharacterized protein n=1 Tax=Rhynchosporium agropyri TaxID=914238 RepID=A0A1E1L985_9HELO|nr:uncharacterized protein RAG0_12515 [Rhynchosporium agropyri]